MRHTLLALALLASAASTKAQWQLQDAHTTADLRGIVNVGSGVAWASGTDGTILRTEDAGIVWQLCAKPPNGEHLDFRAIQAFDNNTAIIMSSGKGDQSRLYKTTDGCQSWKLVLTNPDKDGFWDALRATVSKDRAIITAVVAGDPVDQSFTLFELNISVNSSDVTMIPFASDLCVEKPTRQLPLPIATCLRSLFVKMAETEAAGLEGGRAAADKGLASRLRAYANPAPQQGEALFAASNSSLANHSNTWFSPDIAFVSGGPNGPRFFNYRRWPCAGMGCIYWRVANLPLAAGSASGAFSIAVVATRDGLWHGVVVGGNYQEPSERGGTGAFSVDEGKTWTAATTPPHGYRSAVQWSQSEKLWITAGTNGSDISRDDGRTWKPLDNGNWNALSLPFIVGPNGRIGRLNPEALPKH
jgi:hypothetical protein